MTLPDDRPDWVTYFMMLADQVTRRVTCLSGRRVGCLLVRDRHILATGYNGVPRNLGHPGIDPVTHDCEGCVAKLCLHAEANALAQAARHGVSLKGATCFTTSKPCSQCAGLLVNAGITDVVYRDEYASPHTGLIFEAAGVRLLTLQEARECVASQPFDPSLCSCC